MVNSLQAVSYSSSLFLKSTACIDASVDVLTLLYFITFSSIHRCAGIELTAKTVTFCCFPVTLSHEFLPLPLSGRDALLRVPNSLSRARTRVVAFCQSNAPDVAFSRCPQKRFKLHHILMISVGFIQSTGVF